MFSNFDPIKYGIRKKRIKAVVGVVCATALLTCVLMLDKIAPQFFSYSNEQAVQEVTDTTLSLVRTGYTQWQYWDKTTPPPEDRNGLSWKLPKYELSGWKTGRGTFGADNGQRTDRVNDRYPTNLPVQNDQDGNAIPVHYFRTEFTINGLLPDSQLKGSVQFDDAVMIYLNGELIYSDNVPQGGYDELSGGYGAINIVDKSLKKTFTLSKVSALRNGKNVLAVELHQSGKKSSDLYFDFISLSYGSAAAVGGAAEGNVMLF